MNGLDRSVRNRRGDLGAFGKSMYAHDRDASEVGLQLLPSCVPSKSRYDSIAERSSAVSRPQAEIRYDFPLFVNR